MVQSEASEAADGCENREIANHTRSALAIILRERVNADWRPTLGGVIRMLMARKTGL